MALSSIHFLAIKRELQRVTTTRITGLVKLARAHCILFTLGNSEGYKYNSCNTQYIFTCAYWRAYSINIKRAVF
uniref:Uncharacterized protein n=1 Tax=Populus trichocarpa TaxID=3694 RepID=A0A2K2ASF0_POPTR